MIHREISEYELFLNKKNIYILKELSNNEITSENERFIITLLDKLFIYFFYCKHEYSFEKIYRITINKNILNSNKRIKDIRNLKYPPNSNSVTKYGRCNLPKQSIFYGSLMQMTSLNELKPRVGDLITESTWVTKSKKSLIYIPIFSNQPTNEPFINKETGEIIERLTNLRTYEMDMIFKNQTKDYPKNLKELCYLIVEFIADCFSKKVNSNNHWNYIFSAYLADKFFNKLEDGKVDAIYYPSVQDELNSENLAIKPKVFEELYILSEVRESFVTEDPSDGRQGYYMQGIADCKIFDFGNNEILWEYNKNFQSNETIQFLKRNYGVDLD